MGEDQILMFELMCARDARRPHQMAADLILAAIREAQADPVMAASCAAMAASRARYAEAHADEGPRRRRGLRLVRGGGAG